MNHNETQIVTRLIRNLATAGITLTAVSDGEKDTPVSTMEEAVELLGGLDEATLYFDRYGVFLIFGNGNYGLDVISDYTAVADNDPFNVTIYRLTEWIEHTAEMRLP